MKNLSRLLIIKLKLFAIRARLQESQTPLYWFIKKAISELRLASSLNWVLVLILSYKNELNSFTWKLNSFSYEWLCTRSRFDEEAQGNSEMGYYHVAHILGEKGFLQNG